MSLADSAAAAADVLIRSMFADLDAVPDSNAAAAHSAEEVHRTAAGCWDCWAGTHCPHTARHRTASWCETSLWFSWNILCLFTYLHKEAVIRELKGATSNFCSCFSFLASLRSPDLAECQMWITIRVWNGQTRAVQSDLSESSASTTKASFFHMRMHELHWLSYNKTDLVYYLKFLWIWDHVIHVRI